MKLCLMAAAVLLLAAQPSPPPQKPPVQYSPIRSRSAVRGRATRTAPAIPKPYTLPKDAKAPCKHGIARTFKRDDFFFPRRGMDPKTTFRKDDLLMAQCLGGAWWVIGANGQWRKLSDEEQRQEIERPRAR